MNKERHPPLYIQHDIVYRAFKRGRIINPYKVGSSFYKEWDRGFNKAYFENLEKLNENTA